jgi:hypothetical protein
LWKERDPNGAALRILQNHQSEFEGDPFLVSVFWDKVQTLEMAKGDWASAEDALRRGIQAGYKTPYFYQWLAYDLDKENRKAEAEETFRQGLELRKSEPDSNVGTFTRSNGGLQ